MSTVVTELGDQIEIEIYEGGVSFPGAGGVNGIISGTEAPQSNLGNEGDYYVNTTTFEIYGPKTNGLWGIPTAMRGPQGVQGEQGQQGERGEKGDQANVTGVQINADRELVIEVNNAEFLTFDMSAYIRLFVGDIEIKRKGDGNTDPTIIQTGDVVEFYDSDNGNAKVEGIVKDASVDVKTFDQATRKYTNLRTYNYSNPSN